MGKRDLDQKKNPRKKKKRVKERYELLKSDLNPKVEGISSLMDIVQKVVEYKNIDKSVLHNIFPQLLELNMVIGMESLKKTLFYQILYFIQRLDLRGGDGEYLHTVLTGPPGCGKTTVAKIIGDLYSNLGILSDKKLFRVAKREDFVAEYLGQTAIKTKKLLKSCLGGVLFIDEVYALGPGESNKDSFSKEAIDTINVFLSENKNNFCCIIAGYEDKIKNCFFNVNPGLERRFQWVHNIEPYSNEQLAEIFYKMVRDVDWEILVEKPYLVKIIDKNKELFKHAGGSIETFLSKCKISHAKRVFSLDERHKFVITEDDIDNAFEIINSNKLYIQIEDTTPLSFYM